MNNNNKIAKHFQNKQETTKTTRNQRKEDNKIKIKSKTNKQHALSCVGF